MSASPSDSLRSTVAWLLATACLAFVAGCGGEDGDDEPSAGAPAQTAAAGDEAPAPKASDTRPTRASGVELKGDVAEARRGAVAVDDTYAGLRAAAEAGIAATDVPARQTLDAAGDDPSLARVCELMSAEARRQTVVYVSRSAGLADVDWTCEKATGLLLRRVRNNGGLRRSLRAKLVAVKVDGDRATASVRFGSTTSSIPLVREGGQWKLGATPSGGGGE